MKNTILQQLREIEEEKNIRILLACETGSRGWGFHSPDSDYDVRFIYVHEPDWYISVLEKEDCITLPVSDELDVTGWELRKSLRLLIKHNAALMERLQSPIIYKEVIGFKEEYLEIARQYFSPISVMHHYLSMAKGYLEKCTSEEMKLKSLFYCIRSAMSAHWILKYQTLPHMQLEKLMPVMAENEPLVKRIRELVKLKSRQNESYMHHGEPLILDYLQKTVETCDEGIKTLPNGKYPSNTLDQLLIKYAK